MVQELYKQKRSLELRWQLEYEQEGRYTLDMVRIDDKIEKSLLTLNLKKPKLQIEKMQLKMLLPKFLWLLR